MQKILADLNFKARGNVLPLSEFVLFRDVTDKSFNKRHADDLIKEAEGYLEREIPLLKLSVFREFKLNGNRSNFQQPYYLRRQMAVALALAEYYERQGRFTEKLCDVLWAIMEESTWIIPAHTSHNPVYSSFDVPPVYNDNVLHGIDLFSATTCASLSIIYAYCKDIIDEVSPIICEKLKYMLHDRAIRPFLQVTFSWSGEKGNRVNNWCPWIISNILVTMALTTEDLSLREKVTDKACAILDNFTKDYNEDGGCDEGPSYWGAAGASYFDCLETLYDITAGKVDVYSHPLVKAMGEYIVKFNINNQRFINFADCPPSKVHDGCLIRRFGEKVGSQIMPSFGDKMLSLGSKVYSHYHIYRMIRHIITPDRDFQPIKAATKVWFPNLKVMAARDSEDSAKGMFLAMKGGHNAESHNHNDVGNFVVYYNGNPVIIDTGVGTYTKQTFSARRYELWYMQSSYHNLPDINGVAQKNGIDYRSNDEVYNEDDSSLKLQLKDAYLPEADIKSYTRKASLKDGTVTITDSISLNESHSVTFHFMSQFKPYEAGECTIALAEGRFMTYDKRLTPVIEEFEVADGGMESNWKQNTLFRICFTTEILADEFTFTIK